MRLTSKFKLIRLQAFRIRLDEKRKMFDHLTPEEQAQFKESIRTFRHPRFSKATQEVILADAENAKRKQQQETSWFVSKLKQTVDDYDHNALSEADVSPSSTAQTGGSAGYATTSRRKKVFCQLIIRIDSVWTKLVWVQ